MTRTELTSLAALVLLATTAAAAPAPAPQPASDIAPVWRTDATGQSTQVLPLISLVPGGQARSVRLTGMAKTQFFDFGVRSDNIVSRAQLELAVTASPSVLAATSQLNVYLNGQLQQSVPFSADMVGKPSKLSVTLNPKSIQSQNQISVEFNGHIQSVCENPASDALWLEIGPASRLVLDKQSIRLANDIGKLPAPFVDTATSEATTLPMVFASLPSSKVKTAAAIAASWVGERTYWRGADFPVFVNEVPAGEHFIVFITNDKRPNFLKDFPKAEGPQLTVADAPKSLSDKMLIVSGRNEDDLIAAVKALGREGNVMIGDTFKPAAAADPEPRKAYDAPRWIDTDTKTTFGKLIEYPGQLTSRGYDLPAVHLPVRFAPDLFMVEDATLEMRVGYRTTKPMKEETSQFRAFVNGFLLDSDTTSAADGKGTRLVTLPGFYGALFDNTSEALAVTQTNDFSFEVHYERAYEGGSAENCKSVTMLPRQMDIEPTSTLEISGLYHYARMPNVKLFTQTGYPFTRYADLSQTAVLIKEDASPATVRAMLNAVARMSASTGAFANRIAVTDNPADPILKDKDVLALGSVPVLLTDIDSAGAAELQTAAEKALDQKKHIVAPEGSVIAEGMAAVTGFRSPLNSSRSVVALLCEGEVGAILLGDNLVKPQHLANVSGSTVIITPFGEHSYRTGETYYVGNLPLNHQVWMKLSSHPGWVVFCALLSAVIIGFVIFFLMRRLVGKRA